MDEKNGRDTRITKKWMTALGKAIGDESHTRKTWRIKDPKSGEVLNDVNAVRQDTNADGAKTWQADARGCASGGSKTRLM